MISEPSESVRPAVPKAASEPPLTVLLALLPSWIAFAWLASRASWFWNHRPDLNFGWVVLMLCGYLLWEAWEKRPTVQCRWRLPWLVLAVLGLSLVFLVQIYQAAFGMNAASLAGLAIGMMSLIAANLGYVFGGRGLCQFGFAFGFILIALPMPSVVHNLVVGGLQSKITFLNVEILNLIGIPAQQVGSLIRLPTCTVGVDEACSGIRSLQSTLMATLFIGYLALSKTRFRIVLVFVGVLLAMIGNLGRSLILSYTANAKGLQALESVHDTAGWSILAFTAVGVALLAWFFSKLEKPPPARNAAA